MQIREYSSPLSLAPVALDARKTLPRNVNQFRPNATRLKDWVRLDPVAAAMGLALVLCAGLHLANVLRGWDHTLLDAYGFRQCQTAFSTTLLRQEGFKLAYETPVFGPPWSIPMEAPVYQFIVAALSNGLGSPLEATGRAVSVCFFYASLWPILSILGSLGVNRLGRLFALLFLLSAPHYVFWSRTFMIESTALFLSLLNAALTARAIDGDRRRRVILGAVAAGILGALTKITTFSVCFGFSTLYFLWRHFGRRPATPGKLSRTASLFCLVTLLPLTCGYVWVKYGDHLKRQNPTPMARVIDSTNLTTFNFGTWHQRTTAEFWQAMENYGVRHITTSLWPWLIILLGVALIPRARIPALVLFAAFCSGPLVFGNLYAVHDYYWYANSVFLLMALAVPLGEAADIPGRARSGAATLALLVCLNGWVGYFRSDYFILQNKDETYLHDLGAVVHRHTAERDVIMVIGFDWSSALPYYAQRRAIMPWVKGFETAAGTIQAVRALPQENRQLGLLAVSGQSRHDPAFLKTVTALYGFAEKPFFDDGRTVLFAPQAGLPAKVSTLLGLHQVSLNAPMPVVEMFEDGRQVWRLHAPSRVELTLPPTARGIDLWYGLAKLTYSNGGQTDGASFKIILVQTDGSQKILLHKLLEPKTRTIDQGLHHAEFDFPSTRDARLILETGSNNSSDWDWAVWSKVNVKQALGDTRSRY